MLNQFGLDFDVAPSNTPVVAFTCSRAAKCASLVHEQTLIAVSAQLATCGIGKDPQALGTVGTAGRDERDSFLTTAIARSSSADSWSTRQAAPRTDKRASRST